MGGGGPCLSSQRRGAEDESHEWDVELEPWGGQRHRRLADGEGRGEVSPNSHPFSDTPLLLLSDSSP